MSNVEAAFNDQYIPRIIDKFPYPEKHCRFCTQELMLKSAVHIFDGEEIYKALYVCIFDHCPAYDEPAKKQYIKVYYSSEEALKKLEPYRIWNAVKKR